MCLKKATNSRSELVELYQNKYPVKEVIYLPDKASKQVDILQTFAPNLPDYKAQLIQCIHKLWGSLSILV